MAANTAFADFPRLGALQAADGFLPRQLTFRGSRLVYSSGIVLLAVTASLLVIAFRARVTGLIPLYAIGVFTSFTLGQSGMVNHWRKVRDKGWLKSAIINGFGAAVTLITTIIILFEKFSDGAFIVVILIPIIVFLGLRIKNHYNTVAAGLSISQLDLSKVDLHKNKQEHVVIVPIASLNKAVIGALQYAQSIGGQVYALNVSPDKESMEKLQARWSELDTDIILISKYSPYRAVINPLIKYISSLAAEKVQGDEKVTVVVPQFITHESWGNILHNHTGFILHETLLQNDKVVVSTYPYHL